MSAYEFLLSESQERMLAVVRPENEQAVREVVSRWELECVGIGEVTRSTMFEVWDGETREVCLPISLLTRDAPMYERAIVAPAAPRGVSGGEKRLLAQGKSLEQLGLELLAMPSIRSKRHAFEQFDAHVGLRTVSRSGEAAASVLFLHESGHRIASSVEGHARRVFVDPMEGAARLVAEAARNLSCVGATPRALTDCLNFGDPTHPEVMWELERAIAGMNRACRSLGVPVVSGNVSLYNSSYDRDIYPTPVVAMIGVFEHDAPHVSLTGGRPGDVLLLLGEGEVASLDGSELCDGMLGEVGRCPHRLDLERERSLQACVRELVADELLSVSQDCAQGGVWVALVEIMGQSRVGVEMTLGEVSNLEAMRTLFGERPSRVLVCTSAVQAAAIASRARDFGVPSQRIGRLLEEPVLCWPALGFGVSREVLLEAYEPSES